MLEKFTEKAKRILFLARYEASQTGSKVSIHTPIYDLLSQADD